MGLWMERNLVLRRLLGLGMLAGRVRVTLLGGMGRSRLSRMRLMPWDGWVCVGGFGRRGPSQCSRNHHQLPDHVIMFGREPPGL
jgi:hypothetical protein